MVTVTIFTFLCLLGLKKNYMSEPHIESLLKEQRVFPPSPEFAKHAHIQSAELYESLRKRAAEDPDGFWRDIASELPFFRCLKTHAE